MGFTFQFIIRLFLTMLLSAILTPLIKRKRKMKRYLAMTNNPCYNVFIL